MGAKRIELGGGRPNVAKDHGSSVKDDKQYEGLRKKGMSKERAAKIANTPNASKKGGKSSGGGGGGQSSKGGKTSS
jgi:hypothetical protein